jgi:PAS domain S-box-containing protein
MVSAFAFEGIKQSVFLATSMWQSHLLTILFITASAFVASIGILRREKDSRSALFNELERRQKTEQQLHLQATALESAANAIIIIDHDRTIAWVNPAFTNLTGYSAEEVLGKSARILQSDQHDPALYEDMWRKLREGSVWRGEISSLRKDGGMYFEEVTITPVRATDGNISHFVAIKIDVTERNRSESELRRLNRALSTLSRCNAVLVHATDEAQLLNQICEILVHVGGYRLAWVGSAEHDERKTVRLASKSGFDDGYIEKAQITWDDTERGSGPTGTAIRAGDVCIARDILRNPQFRPWRDDASRRGYASNIALPLREGSQIIGALTIYASEPDAFDNLEVQLLKELAADLSYGIEALRNAIERRRTEAALRESEERYRMLFARNPHSMWIFDVNTLAFLEVNDAAIAEYGYSREEFLGMTIEDIRPPEDIPTLLTVLSLAGCGYRSTGTFRHRKKDGTIIRVEISAYRFLQDGKSLSLALSNDVTERLLAEEAVRRSEAELRSFVEKSTFGIFRSSIEEDRFLSVNPALIRMLGYASEEEILSIKVSADAHLDPKGREKILALLVGDGGFNGIEFQCRRKNGETITARLSGRLVQDSITGDRVFEGVAEDVTERTQAEQALRESEERFRLVVEGAPIGILVQVDGIYRYLNPAALAMFGAETADQLIGYPVAERVHPESQAAVTERIRMLKEQCTNVPSLEERLLRLDGTPFDVEATAIRFVFERHEGSIVFVRDITERKREEQARRESEERFRLVVEGAPVGMFIQTDGLFRYLNPAALTLFGAETTDQIVGQSLTERIDPDFRNIVNERIRIAKETRKAVPFMEQRHLRLDGTVFNSEVSAIPFTFEGRDGGLVFVRDITERKREQDKRHALEQQLLQAQKMEAVGRLAGGIAHDFNNILMAIQTYTEMLRDHLPVHDSLRRNTGEVLEAAARGASLTRQMLAFSRKQIISPIVLDLNAVIDNATKMLRRLIGEDIEFQVDSVESVWAIEADPDQIVQVLMNLCINARDAMPQGGTLTIATGNVTLLDERLDEDGEIPRGGYVKLAVTDTGVGINKDLLKQIFEPFFTTKEVGKGTGLGLATVYGIVKQGGGYVRANSELGKGSCFTIYLPKVERPVAPTLPTNAQAAPRGTETLLVVEDESFIRKGMCEFLCSLGYKVLDASSGSEALLVAAEQERIDLLLTDVVMPQMSGRELSQLLGNQRPNLKIIHMSGYTDDAVLLSGVHDLRTSFLQKPFSLGTLARKVRETLECTNTVQ